MARPLVSIIGVLPAAAAVTYLITLSAVLSVFSVVIFLCGAHRGMIDSVMGKERTKTVRLGSGCSTEKKMISRKALLMSKMISWRKVDDDDDEDGAVWKKTIIRGEKCRPLEFSGKILYDSHGNLLPDLAT